jgi:hypothetical protein
MVSFLATAMLFPIVAGQLRRTVPVGLLLGGVDPNQYFCWVGRLPAGPDAGT